MIAFIDTETTGLNFKCDRVVQVGMVIARMEGGNLTHLLQWSRVVRPEPHRFIPTSPYHNITQARAMREGVPLDEALAELEGFLWEHSVQKMVAYNARFDFNMLAAELRRCGYTHCSSRLLSLPWDCAMERAKPLYGRYPKLAVVAHDLQYGPFRAHDALEDVLATAHVYSILAM